MEARYTLQGPKIDINLGCFERGGCGCVVGASPADGDGESLNVEGEMGKDEGVIGRYLVLDWRGSCMFGLFIVRCGRCGTGIHNSWQESVV